jgi:hypothetical protein
MFETNTQNNPTLISLSRAAQLTGYHQDYLGQLCRLGKLSATKIGRNWFTSPEALNRLSAIEESIAQSDEQEEQDSQNVAGANPPMIQTITVSQVEDMPIAIRTVPMPVRGMNSVQNILTTMRIETLQKEVSELREMLLKLMAEVGEHSIVLQAKSMLAQQDQLRHSYISNFDYNSASSAGRATNQQPAPDIMAGWEEPRESKHQTYTWAMWSLAVIVLVAIAGIASTMMTGEFFGPRQPEVSTIYHHSVTASTELQPTVAGDTTPQIPFW